MENLICIWISRGRGSYRGRGRGNFYRQDRNASQQHHQHQHGVTQQHPNVPYYDQSMNLMNTGMAGNQGGYGDGVYHDAPSNRYDRIYIFSKKFVRESFSSNGSVGNFDQRHLFQCFIYYIIFGTFIQNFIFYVFIKDTYRINLYVTNFVTVYNIKIALNTYE